MAATHTTTLVLTAALHRAAGMLKIQLACKDVIKAGKVKAPGADWATRLLAGNSGAEWRSIAAKLQEGARVGGAWDLAAITLDTGLLDAAAAAIRLARTAKTADPMLTTSLQEFFEVLSTSYSSHVWRVPSLLCTLREAALAGLKPHHLPLYNSVAAFFLVATSALRSGDNKGMYERFFAASDDTAEPSNLLLLLHLGSHAQLGAILFPALNEWTAFFPASITPEEVAKITAGAGETGAAPPATEGQADEGQQGQQSKRRRKDAKRQDGDAAPPGGEAGRGSKRGTLSALFVELQRLRACADLPAGCEFRIGTLFRAFEHSVKASDPLGTVRAFFAPPGESGAAAAAAAPAEAEPSKAAGAPRQHPGRYGGGVPRDVHHEPAVLPQGAADRAGHPTLTHRCRCCVGAGCVGSHGTPPGCALQQRAVPLADRHSLQLGVWLWSAFLAG